MTESVWVLLYRNPQDEHDNGMVGVYATDQLARDAAIERANWGHRGPKRVFFWQDERLVFEVSGKAFEHQLHYRVEACEVSRSNAAPSDFVFPVSEDFDPSRWPSLTEEVKVSEEPKACPGASVPCPSWQEVTAEIVEVCNCHERWGQWGNPWGDPTCAIHGELVAEQVKAWGSQEVSGS